jgi:hypothetical protein
VYTIGIVGAKAKVGMMNRAVNILRLTQLGRQNTYMVKTGV